MKYRSNMIFYDFAFIKVGFVEFSVGSVVFQRQTKV